MMTTATHPAIMKAACDEQDNLLLRSVCKGVKFFCDLDLYTLEAIFAFLQIVLAGAVLVLSARIIATPPPFVQGWALLLPAPVWGGFLLTATWGQLWGRYKNDWHYRRDGAVGALLTCAALCGPLWIKAPGLCTMILMLLCPQALFAGRVNKEAKRVRQSADTKGQGKAAGKKNCG